MQPTQDPQLALYAPNPGFTGREAELERLGEGHRVGDEAAARKRAEELGLLPLALEQAVAFIIELRWSFDKYRERLRKLLECHWEGATRYPASVAKTWNITLEKLNPLARELLRLAACFGPDAIPRGIFSADPAILSEGLGESIEDLDAIEEALGELASFSLIRLTPETVSVHRLLQPVEQDALTKEECALARVGRPDFQRVCAGSPDDARTWSIWLVLRPHAEALITNTESRGMNAAPVGILANQFALFLEARANYTQAEPLYRRALRLLVQSSRSLPRNPQTGALVKYQQNVPFCRVSAEKGGRWF